METERKKKKTGFPKGISGNPSGRPKLSDEDREFFQENFYKLSKKAIARFHQILDDDNADPELWAKVSKPIFQHYFGINPKGFSGEEQNSGTIVVVMGEDMAGV